MFGKKAMVLFVVLIGLGLILAGCGGHQPAPEKKAEKRILKLSSVLPDSHPTHKAMVWYADQVKEKTKGQVEIQVFPSSQLGEQRDALEGMKMGTLDMAMTNCGPLGQFVPTIDVLNLPFMFRNPEHQAKVLDGKPGDQLIADINKAGFVFLFWADAGSRSVINNKRPINSPDDLKGLKIRVMNSQLMVNTLNAMGAIATPMGQGEVYSALQQGVIDGWENNPTTLYTLKLYEVSKYFSWTRHFSTPDAILISKKVFDTLTPEQQKIMVEVGKEGTKKARQLWAETEKKHVEELVKKGVIFNEVKDVQPFVERVKPVWKNYTDKFGTKLVDEIQNTK